MQSLDAIIDHMDEHFRRAMRGYAGTVSVVTARAGSQWLGITATSVIPVSMAPPSLLVSIHQRSSMIAGVRSSGAFCVNVLGGAQAEHCRAFSGRVKGETRFAGGDWQLDCDGLPFLTNAQTSIACSVATETQFGTHCMFVGVVKRIRLQDTIDPLVYLNGATATVKSDPRSCVDGR